jgi:hypothetical protein
VSILTLDIIAELWAAGASFTDMGRKLGVSRSIVAGRIDPARKSGDSRFAPRPKPEPIVVAKPVATPPAPKNLLLVDAPWNGCRWPTGAAPDGRHLFCGQPQAHRGPYCQQDHDAVARISSSPAPSSSPRAPGFRRAGV